MDKQNEAEMNFQFESGKRQSDRLMQDCFDGLCLLLHGKHVQINGKGYLMKVINHNGKIMFDIRDLPGFDHVEFTIEKTGWGREV